MTVGEINQYINKLKAKKDISDESLAKLKAKEQQLTKETKLAEKGAELARLCIEKSLSNRNFIQQVVNDGVKTVFGSNYEFRYEDSRAKDGTLKGIKLILKKDNIEFTNIRDGCGDALADTLDLMHRVIFADFNPECANLLVLDEPLSSADEHTAERFLEWLNKYCIDNDFQVVLTSHHRVKVGKVYEVKMDKGISSIYDVE